MKMLVLEGKKEIVWQQLRCLEQAIADAKSQVCNPTSSSCLKVEIPVVEEEELVAGAAAAEQANKFVPAPEPTTPFHIPISHVSEPPAPAGYATR